MKLRARLVRLLETVENVGPEALREPHVKHLDGKLWELRVRAEGGTAPRRLGTTQSAIARLEGDGVSPSTTTLRRYAKAVVLPLSPSGPSPTGA